MQNQAMAGLRWTVRWCAALIAAVIALKVVAGKWEWNLAGMVVTGYLALLVALALLLRPRELQIRPRR